MSAGALQFDNSPLLRRVIQATQDLTRRPWSELRILDLACAHGAYSLELAHLGAQVLGIEGRVSWLEHALAAKTASRLPNVDFVQDDVRNLTRQKYGEFDVVLCLGILYHLDAPDVFAFIDSVGDVCRELAIVETHVAREPRLSRDWRGRRYWGSASVEHAPGTPEERKLENLGASLDNDSSFWMSEPSLCNLLRHAGFTSVYEIRNPLAHLYVGAERQFKMWGNRVTLAGIKGRPVTLVTAPHATAAAERDWPESVDEHRFERFIAEIGWNGEIAPPGRGAGNQGGANPA